MHAKDVALAASMKRTDGKPPCRPMSRAQCSCRSQRIALQMARQRSPSSKSMPRVRATDRKAV